MLPKHQRLSAEKTFPSPKSTLPYWRKELHPLDSYRSTECLPSTTDIAIIGAGMTGISTAYHILKLHESQGTKPPSITVLEARQLCSGATGRNGGHLKLPPFHVAKMLDEHGLKAANQLAEFFMEQMYALKDVVEGEKLDCDLLITRSFNVFMEEDDAEHNLNEIRMLFDQGVDVVKREVLILKKDMIEAATGIKNAAGAISVPAAQLWPYRFVTQLAARIIDRINLQTHTMVEKVNDEPDDEGLYTITTSRGSIQASKVVYATNGYTAGVLPCMEGVITPYRGTNSYMRRPNQVQSQWFGSSKKADTTRWPTRCYTYNVSIDSEHIEYIVHRPDGGTILGGAKKVFEEDTREWLAVVDDSTLMKEEQVREYFKERMETYYDDWTQSGAEVDMIWSGSKLTQTPVRFVANFLCFGSGIYS